jgi:RNA polymerase sigma-70 factor (ECF subfamily)
MLYPSMDSIESLYRDSARGFREALAPIVGSREVADDIVQESFAVAYRKRGSLREERSVGPWVWQIAYRLALRERSRQGKLADLPDDLTIFDEERDPEMAAAIRVLTPQRRLVVFLHYFAGFTYPEIADTLDIAEGTVAATLAQARRALYRELTSQEVAQ